VHCGSRTLEWISEYFFSDSRNREFVLVIFIAITYDYIRLKLIRHETCRAFEVASLVPAYFWRLSTSSTRHQSLES
jgi:hypothetical protein